MEDILARGFARALQFRGVKVKEPTGTSVCDVPDGCLASAFRHLHSQDDREAVSLTCRRWCALESLSRHTLRFVRDRATPPHEAEFLNKRFDEAEFLNKRFNYALRRFPHILSITVIRFTHLPDAFFQIFESRCFAKLTDLHLHFCLQITDKTVDYLIMGCPVLTRLTLTLCTRISNVSLHALAHGIPRLEYLDISYCETVTDEGIDDVLKSCPNMQEISFSYCFKVDGWGLRNGKNLKKVQAEACLLTDAGLAEGLKGATSIQTFNLADLKGGGHLGGIGLGQLGASSAMMQVLCLRRCPVLDDATVAKIAQGCVNLRVWDLSRSPTITFDGWQAVALYCAKLQFLDVHQSRHFCDRSMLAIQESCPSLRCIYVLKCSLPMESCERFTIERPNVRVETSGALINCCHIT